MRFKVKNSDIFPMPGDSRFLHLATVEYGLQEFVAFVGRREPYLGKCYIEEVVLASDAKNKDIIASLKFIEDDNLAEDLMRFLEDKKLLDIKERTSEMIDKGKSKWVF